MNNSLKKLRSLGCIRERGKTARLRNDPGHVDTQPRPHKTRHWSLGHCSGSLSTLTLAEPHCDILAPSSNHFLPSSLRKWWPSAPTARQRWRSLSPKQVAPSLHKLHPCSRWARDKALAARIAGGATARVSSTSSCSRALLSIDATARQCPRSLAII